jgi:hypothetical protein
VLVAAHLQAFQGIEDGMSCWSIPSSSILRYSTDVWFFWVLSRHLRADRRSWAAAAGVVAGLALLLGFDTGIYLLVVLGFYLALRMIFGPTGRLGPTLEFRRELVTSSLALSAALATIVAGFAAATRRSPLAFDRGLLGALFEPLVAYSGGMGCEPMSTTPGYWGQCFFLLVAGTYLLCLGSLVSCLLGPGADRRQVLRGCVAAYGLATALLFVQRSHPFNLFHSIIPFVILLVDGTHASLSRLGSRAGRLGGSIAIGAVALGLLLANRHVQGYPGLIQNAIRGEEPTAVLFQKLDALVVPYNDETLEYEQEFQKVTTRLSRLRAVGVRVAILDEAEPMFEVASGVAPCDRYVPLFTNLLTRPRLEAAKARFIARGFGGVVLRSGADPGFARSPPEALADVRGEFRQLVQREFVLRESIGRYEFWSSRGPESGSPNRR